MPVEVEIKNRQRRLKLSHPGIEKLVDWVIRQEGCAEAEVSLLFVNNQGIRELNRQYLGRDYPTDVLVFPQRRKGGGDIHPRFLGDVVISTQRVQEQAPEYQQKLEDEFCLCLIHGLLHLFGYRDHPARSRLRMRKREEELLAAWKRRKKWSLISS